MGPIWTLRDPSVDLFGPQGMGAIRSPREAQLLLIPNMLCFILFNANC